MIPQLTFAEIIGLFRADGAAALDLSILIADSVAVAIGGENFIFRGVQHAYKGVVNFNGYNRYCVDGNLDGGRICGSRVSRHNSCGDLHCEYQRNS